MNQTWFFYMVRNINQAKGRASEHTIAQRLQVHLPQALHRHGLVNTPYLFTPLTLPEHFENWLVSVLLPTTTPEMVTATRRAIQSALCLAVASVRFIRCGYASSHPHHRPQPT